jgi:hypothetical protein
MFLVDISESMSDSESTNVTNGPTWGMYTSRPCLDSTIISLFCAIACYNSIEIVVLCFSRFKKKGCYFYSMLAASLGIVVDIVGLILKLFGYGSPLYVPTIIGVTGWCFMVTGQSMVLYSRLHLLLHDKKILRAILYMIIVDAVILHVPSAVLIIGANTPSQPDSFARVYNIVERIELIGFCIQEMLISGVYIWQTLKFLKLSGQNQHRALLRELLVINATILLLDSSTVATEYAGFFAIQITFKPMVYSIKLKLEYIVLGKLVKVVREKRRNAEWYPSTILHSSIWPNKHSGQQVSSHESVDLSGCHAPHDADWNDKKSKQPAIPEWMDDNVSLHLRVYD